MYTYLPDLLAIQLASFKYFVESEISKEITYAFRELRVPIHPYGTLRFDAAEYKLLHPTCTPYKASYTWQTYGVTLYVPARAHAERAYTVSGPGVEQDPTYRGILRDRYYPLAHLPLQCRTLLFRRVPRLSQPSFDEAYPGVAAHQHPWSSTCTCAAAAPSPTPPRAQQSGEWPGTFVQAAQ